MSDTTRTAPEGAETLAPEPVEKSSDGSEAESDLIVATLAEETDDDVSIRPFSFEASEEDLADLRRRILTTRWPDRETVDDDSQGVQLATMQKLADYWVTDYDWRTCEARLNALPNFVTEIDGLDIHFIHVNRSMRMRCRSSSRTAGRARLSSSSRSSSR